MNNTLRKKILIISILMFLLCLADLAIAGESRSISISIVIPEIPGVNVPTIQESAIQTKIPNTTIEQNKQNLGEKNENVSPETIQEDEEKEMQLAEGKDTSVVIVKTMYSR